MTSQEYREEQDLLGTYKIPKDVLYGIQTQRGIENFKISKIEMNHYPNYIKGFAITKKCAAQANFSLGLITESQLKAVSQACDEIKEGKLHENFITDLIQGGAGTTMNMNVHDVVNRSHSTNYAFPTSFHLGLYLEHNQLNNACNELINSFLKKSEEFKNILKMGRTQLQDGVPMTLGQSFHGYSTSIKEQLVNLNKAAEGFLEINMGATAIGTGICSEPGYTEKIIECFRKETGWDIKLSQDLVFVTSDTSPLINYSSELRHLSLKLIKICNDLRLMSSGPRCGFEEINLPQMQPGSSLMPGKVNPVIPEVVGQVCYKVIGNDTTVMLGSENAQLELNVFEPVMVYCIFESIDLLTNAINTFINSCINGIVANKEICEKEVKSSIGIVTALNPYIGYDNSTFLAKEAMNSGKSIYDLVIEKNILTKDELDTILKPENMVHPVKLNIAPKNKI